MQAAHDTPENVIDFARSAREAIDALTVRFSTQKTERPNVEDITAAVRACAHLNPVEWAVQRNRLKSVCGDTVKQADLEQLYRQARKELASQNAPAAIGSENYFEADGGMIVEKMTERGLVRTVIADWTATVQERVTRMDDDGEPEHIVTLRLCDGTHITTLQLEAALFGDDAALRRAIAGAAGERFIVRAGAGRHLPSAIRALSGVYPVKTNYRFIGWTKINGEWNYVSPWGAISRDGEMTTPPEVELEQRLKDYGITAVDWTESLNAFKAAIAVMPKHMAATLVSFSLLPLLQRFFPTAAPRPAIHLVGTSGSGKSEIAALMASFFGSFTRDTPPAQWGDTINTVETLGYALADALYWVDDYKAIYADEKTFTRFLQSYSRGMGRGRLTKDAKLRQERPCRGLILSTGETTIEGEASVLSRMLVLEIPPWEQRDPGGKALVRAESLRHALPGFTAAFARWIAEKADTNQLHELIKEQFKAAEKGYRVKLTAAGVRQANTGRMIGNWSVLNTVYKLLLMWLTELDADDALPNWQDSIVETIETVQQERAGRVFIDTLAQLLAAGKVAIVKRDSADVRPGCEIIGYDENNSIYLLQEVALRIVSQYRTLKFTERTIGSQLKEDGILIGPKGDHLGTKFSVNGGMPRLWRLIPTTFMGGDKPE